MFAAVKIKNHQRLSNNYTKTASICCTK